MATHCEVHVTQSPTLSDHQVPEKLRASAYPPVLAELPIWFPHLWSSPSLLCGRFKLPSPPHKALLVTLLHAQFHPESSSSSDSLWHT